MRKETEILATFVHGCLASLHLLGCVYNLRRKNYWDAAAHATGVLYDSWATHKHMRRVRED